MSLPHPETLQNLISSYPCTFGFNEFALESIQRIFAGKSLGDRLGSLMFDEITLEENLDFNGQKLCIDGYVDYGKETIDVDEEHPKLADHALVFVFKPYKASWIQPIGVFATSGAASGEDLKQLVDKALTILEQRGARVTNIVCDGAQTNRAFWKKCMISGKTENLKHYMSHPLLEEAKVYFLSDVPHLFKCVRNYIWNRKVVQVL